MNPWYLLVGAVLTEVAGSLSLKAALDNPAWYIVVVAGYATAFSLLSLVLKRGMALGVAYGIWGASGVALTAILSALLFGEPMSGGMIAGIGLIILGVLTIELGSHRAAEAEVK